MANYIHDLQNEINRTREELTDIKEISNKMEDVCIREKLDEHKERLEKRLDTLIQEQSNLRIIEDYTTTPPSTKTLKQIEEGIDQLEATISTTRGKIENQEEIPESISRWDFENLQSKLQHCVTRLIGFLDDLTVIKSATSTK